MGNCVFLRTRGWGIDRQVRKKLQIPGGVPGGGMVTGRIEPCITQAWFTSTIEKTQRFNNSQSIEKLITVFHVFSRALTKA